MPSRDKPFVVLRSETGIHVVMLSDEIDHHVGVPRLEKTFARLRTIPCAKVILNFREVCYCCSSGIAAVLDLADAVHATGGIVLIAAAWGPAREPMDLLRIPDIIPFYDSVVEALEAIEEDAVKPAPSI